MAGLLEDPRPGAPTRAALQPVAEVLAALLAEPAPDELAGQDAALAEFRRRGTQSGRRRRPVRAVLLSAKAAAIAAIASAGLGGVAVATYTGNLPAPLQRVAHAFVGAPAAGVPNAGVRQRATASPPGPPASGSPAFGLCTAYENALVNGTAAQRAIAFGNVAAAAGGAGNVAAYCGALLEPGASPSARPSWPPAAHPTGRPTATPSLSGHPHPTGDPTPKPTGTPLTSPTRG